MQNSSINFFNDSNSWVISSDIEFSIRTKIEKYGIPLKDWNIKIYRGVLTGLNDAFIIDENIKNQLIIEDPKSAEIIRPILRGRNIKRYSYDFKLTFMICTFPSLKINIDEYPAIKKYLLSYGIERLEQSGKEYIVNGLKIKSRKKTNNKWYETQDSIAYWEDFNVQNLAWQRITQENKFCITKEGTIILDSMAFINTSNDKLRYLAGFLNSTLITYWINKNVPMYGDKGYRLSNQFVEIIPIPDLIEKEKLIYLVEQQLLGFHVENKINDFVFNSYHLSEVEKKYILSHFSFDK